MPENMLALKWKEDPDAKGYTDVFPTRIFSTAIKHQPALIHIVRGPHGGQYKAKCHVIVKKRFADLDYAAFPAFNTQHGMYLGVLRLKFSDADHMSFSGAEWKGEGDEQFAVVVLELVEYKLQPITKPYVPGPATAAKVLQKVRQRPGQVKFRATLKMAYGCCCAITGCSVSEVLEGAHIDPYKGHSFDHPQNGLLLRRDLHSLFDANLLGVEPKGRRVWLAESVRAWPEYATLHGRVLREPDSPNETYRPAEAALVRRWNKVAH